MRKTTKQGKIWVSSSRAATNVRRSKGGWGNRYTLQDCLFFPFLFSHYTCLSLILSGDPDRRRSLLRFLVSVLVLSFSLSHCLCCIPLLPHFSLSRSML